MNIKIKTTIAACMAIPLLGSCLEETFPSSSMTHEQVEQSSSSLESLNNAMARQLMTLGQDYSSIGYPGIMLSLDVAAGELPVAATSYDYFPWYANDTYLGETGLTIYDWWAMYSNLIHCANLVIKAAPQSSEASVKELGYLGNALAYRAMAYMDMVRLYEYKHTGVQSLDAKAETTGVYKLTVPLVTENTTEAESRNNPRQPFYVMYRFIMGDLDRAEIYLQGTNYSTYNMADAAVVAGLKARLWLEMGSRFTLYPEDLSTMLAHEDDESMQQYPKLGVGSAKECFAKAATYARMAINEGATPLTKEEWHDTKTGFNTANHAWLWAEQISTDDVSSSSWAYFSVVGIMSPEASYGVAESTYGATRMIDASLYATIEDGDWRKATWIAPADAGNPQKAASYSTQLDGEQWSTYPAYSGFKFRPGKGDMNNYKTGVATDIPLMRVEEMYLIEAEGLAHSQGVSAGVRALEKYINKYRYDNNSYQCTAADIDKFTDEILRQRRIEFWGEGIVGYDYKRLEKAVVKKYDGSNHPESYQNNTLDGYVAPRFNLCFPQSSEMLYNSALKNNPDPGVQ